MPQDAPLSSIRCLVTYDLREGEKKTAKSCIIHPLSSLHVSAMLLGYVQVSKGARQHERRSASCMSRVRVSAHSYSNQTSSKHLIMTCFQRQVQHVQHPVLLCGISCQDTTLYQHLHHDNIALKHAPASRALHSWWINLKHALGACTICFGPTRKP